MDKLAELLIAMACVVGIAAGGLYIYKHVDFKCIDLGFYKACGAGVSK